MNNHWLMTDEINEEIKAKEEITERWERIGILEGIKSKRLKTEVAVLMENQRLFNEENSDDAQFKRISIPMVRRIYADSIIDKIASLQANMVVINENGKINDDNKGHYFYTNKEDDGGTWITRQDVKRNDKGLKVVWFYVGQKDFHANALDAEAEFTAVLTQEVNMEIDRETLTYMLNGAGTVGAWDFNSALDDTIKEKYEFLYVKLVETSHVIHNKIGNGANWIVTSPEIASIFETATVGFYLVSSDDWSSSLGIQYVGTINNRWKLYKDPLFPTNRILMGYRGEEDYDAGYFYCPCLPLKKTPTILDPHTFVPRNGLITNYAKHLHNPDYFATLKIVNFVI